MSMDFHTLLLQILFLTSCMEMLAFGFVNQNERKCKYSRVNKLYTVRCYDMILRAVPQNLKSSIEVLDLTFNRIKKLNRSSFERYSDIQFLLLYDNVIQSVEPGTFEALTSLQEIDLSNNALMTIPLELFELPKLRNLYVDGNDLRFLAQDLEMLTKPIKAPLEYLNIANCDLQDLPDLGIMPKLWHINASSNPLTDLQIKRFGNMCHLKTIDITKTQISKCHCQQINYHLSALGADRKFTPICFETLDDNECPLPYNQTVDSAAFKSCLTTNKLAEARSFWLLAAGCISGVILVLLFVWCCVRRQRKQRAKRKNIRALQNRKNSVISPRNAINNNSRSSRGKQEDELLRCDTA